MGQKGRGFSMGLGGEFEVCSRLVLTLIPLDLHM